MTPADIIVIALIAIIVGGASYYIYRAKKNGRKCIGCPDSSKCSGHCASCSCGCGSKEEQSQD